MFSGPGPVEGVADETGFIYTNKIPSPKMPSFEGVMARAINEPGVCSEITIELQYKAFDSVPLRALDDIFTVKFDAFEFIRTIVRHGQLLRRAKLRKARRRKREKWH